MSPSQPIVHGSPSPPPLLCSIPHLLRQLSRFSDREAVVAMEGTARLTYPDLNEKSQTIARALIAHGIGQEDKVGIFLGNCETYAEIFLATSRIGAVAVLLNGTYSVHEAISALRMAECSILFTSRSRGTRGSAAFLDHVNASKHGTIRDKVPGLTRIVVIEDKHTPAEPLVSYNAFLRRADAIERSKVTHMETSLNEGTACCFLFTSGTTGSPKIAMLTHGNIVNNGYLVGNGLLLTEKDVICCPFPLFHSSGLVVGLMTCLAHGSCIVFPSVTFDAATVLRCIATEHCTGIVGAPTMLALVLKKKRSLNASNQPSIHLRTGLIGGASCPDSLWVELQEEFGFENLVNAYGMTETSPISFMSKPGAELPPKLHILPHTSAKVVNSTGTIMPLGCRGELCVSGYLLQKGYYKNAGKTNEAMVADEMGTVWMHTGDESILDAHGQCQITGRIKDIIIRGGENIYPAEIEERLNEHPSISGASVVGLDDYHLGQVVAAFVQRRPHAPSPSDAELASWVRRRLGAHKSPSWIFWMGCRGLPDEFPLTGSGKARKNVLQEMGRQLTRTARQHRL